MATTLSVCRDTSMPEGQLSTGRPGSELPPVHIGLMSAMTSTRTRDGDNVERGHAPSVEHPGLPTPTDTLTR